MDKTLKPISKEAQREMEEDMERYTQPTDEAIIEYSRQWLEKRIKRAKERKVKETAE